MVSRIRFRSFKWFPLASIYLLPSSGIVCIRTDASISVVRGAQEYSDPAIWDAKNTHSVIKGAEIPHDSVTFDANWRWLSSPSENSSGPDVPLQVYSRKLIQADPTSDDQTQSSKFTRTSSSATTKKNWRGMESGSKAIEFSSACDISAQGVESRMLLTDLKLSTHKFETVSNDGGSERRTSARWVPSCHSLQAAKQAKRVYHPEMFRYMGEESIRFEIDEEETARVVRKGLNDLERILRQKLPWKTGTTIRELEERFVQIKYILTFMVQGPLHEPKSVKFKKIRTKAFAHHESQIKVLTMLKHAVGLMIGIQDSLTTRLKGSTALPELMNTLKIFELVRQEAVVPVSQRIESELKDTIINSEDYIDLEFTTFDKKTRSHSHIDSEELEPMLQVDVLSSLIKEALRLDGSPEVERSVAQIPDNTNDLFDTLRNLQKCQVDFQQSPSSISSDVYDLFEQNLKQLRWHINKNSSTSSWAISLVKQGMPDKPDWDVILQDMLVSNVFVKVLRRLLLNNKYSLGFSSYDLKTNPRNYHDLTFLMIEKLQHVESKIAKKQSNSLVNFFNRDVANALTNRCKENESLDLVGRVLKNGNMSLNSQTKVWLQNTSRSLEDILGYTHLKLNHQMAIENIEGQLQIFQHSILRNRPSDRFLGTLLLHQIQGWLRKIEWIGMEKKDSFLIHTLDKSDKNNAKVKFEYQVEKLIIKIKKFREKLEVLLLQAFAQDVASEPS